MMMKLNTTLLNKERVREKNAVTQKISRGKRK